MIDELSDLCEKKFSIFKVEIDLSFSSFSRMIISLQSIDELC